jgi:hypothetical protein
MAGCPLPWMQVKRMVIPDALRVLRLQHGHKFCKLGDLSAAVRGGHRGAGARRELGTWQGVEVEEGWNRAKKGCPGTG